MPHIHTNQGQHDLVVSAFIVRTDFTEPKVMLHLHKKLGTYLQFGGHVELDENPWQAIAHELKEETGYELDQLRILQPAERLERATGSVMHPQPLCINTHPFKDASHFHIDIDYAFVTDQAPRHAIGDDESSDVLLLSRAEVVAMPADKMFINMKEITLFLFDKVLPNWHAVETSAFTLH